MTYNRKSGGGGNCTRVPNVNAKHTAVPIKSGSRLARVAVLNYDLYGPAPDTGEEQP
jgi:hypothetical protein